MPRQVLILSSRAAEYQALLEAAGLPDLALTDDPSQAEIVLGEPDRVAPQLSGLPRLRWVQSTWAGVEPLLRPGRRRDYALTNARGVFGPLITEYVFAYLLDHERGLPARRAAQRAGRWDQAPPGQLRGKTLGLLGVGSIGAHLAAAAQVFGLRVHGYTRASAGCPAVDAHFHAGQELEFAAGLDYLVCTLPDTPATRGLVGAPLLAALPRHAVFINVGRGSTVVEDDLLAALNAGALAAAVLDVTQSEPLPAGHPFWTAPRLTLTCHTAAPSLPADVAGVFSENYRRYHAGAPLRWAVDFAAGY